MTSESVFCTNCGSANASTNAICTNCGKPLVIQASPPSSYAQPVYPTANMGKKPGKVQLIAILCLLDGGINLVWALTAAISLFVGNFLACYQTPYCAVLGILEIIYGVQLLSNPMKVTKPAQYLAIMQIINIITLNGFSLFLGSPAVGIISLIVYSSSDIQAYFGMLQARPTVK